MGERVITRVVEYPIAWRFKLDANTPKPLTGYKVLIQMRAHDRADEVIKEWTEVSPEVTFTPLTGAAALVQLPTLGFDFSSAPIYVNPSEFIAIAKKKVGTAPSAGVIAYTITPIYSWE